MRSCSKTAHIKPLQEPPKSSQPSTKSSESGVFFIADGYSSSNMSLLSSSRSSAEASQAIDSRGSVMRRTLYLLKLLFFCVCLRCSLANWGSEIKDLHGLHTHFSCIRNLTGSLDSILAIMS
ncbi:Uncharacterized protein TCM_020259 [Theobroma cacao]|uniref:Uncharacterized protein n=1 Tax=Theobroma cacao TaxID=3641 RepID=A0A061EK33_THECC|nr:Uncharacterized protein TCM_020259 [Theobroma cacao]